MIGKRWRPDAQAGRPWWRIRNCSVTAIRVAANIGSANGQGKAGCDCWWQGIRTIPPCTMSKEIQLRMEGNACWCWKI